MWIAIEFRFAHVRSEHMISLGWVINEGGLFQEPPLLRYRPCDSSQQTNKQTKVTQPMNIANYMDLHFKQEKMRFKRRKGIVK